MPKKHPKLEEIIVRTIKLTGHTFGPYYTAKTKNGSAITSALEYEHLYESLRLRGYTEKEISGAKRQYQDDDLNPVDMSPEYWSAGGWR